MGDYPTIPRVQPQVSPNARLSGDAPAAAFGGMGPVPDATAGLLSDRFKAAQEAQQQDDFADVSKQLAALASYKNDALYNEQTGVVAQKGDKARNLVQPVMEDFRKQVGTLSQGLGNERARQLFQKHADDMGSGVEQTTLAHSAGERQKYIAQQSDAYVEAQQNAAALAGGARNYGAVDKAANDIYANRAAWAQAQGMSQDERDLVIAKDTSKVYSGAIMSMLTSGQDQAAAEYFKQNADKLQVAQDRQHLEHLIETGTYRGDSQRKTEEIFKPVQTVTKTSESGNKIAFRVDETPPSEADTYAAVDKIKDPKLQDQVRDRVRQRWADVKRAQAEDYDSALQEAGQTVYKTGRIDNVPTVTMDRLKIGDIEKLKTLAEKIRSGAMTETDPIAFSDLMLQARNDPNAFVKRNLLLDLPKLSQKHYEHFFEMQNKMAKDDPKTASMLDFGQRVQDTALANGIFSDVYAKLEGDEKKRYAQFSLSADSRIRQFEATELQGKRPATPQEQQKVIDQMLLEPSGESKGALWWKKPLLGGAVLSSEVTVPDAKKTEFSTYLKSIGKQANDDKLKRMYRAALAGDRGLFDRISGE